MLHAAVLTDPQRRDTFAAIFAPPAVWDNATASAVLSVIETTMTVYEDQDLLKAVRRDKITVELQDKVSA